MNIVVQGVVGGVMLTRRGTTTNVIVVVPVVMSIVIVSVAMNLDRPMKVMMNLVGRRNEERTR